jgi:hypothetical protein
MKKQIKKGDLVKVKRGVGLYCEAKGYSTYLNEEAPPVLIISDNKKSTIGWGIYEMYCSWNNQVLAINKKGHEEDGSWCDIVSEAK